MTTVQMFRQDARRGKAPLNTGNKCDGKKTKSKTKKWSQKSLYIASRVYTSFPNSHTPTSPHTALKSSTHKKKAPRQGATREENSAVLSLDYAYNPLSVESNVRDARADMWRGHVTQAKEKRVWLGVSDRRATRPT